MSLCRRLDTGHQPAHVVLQETKQGARPHAWRPATHSVQRRRCEGEELALVDLADFGEWGAITRVEYRTVLEQRGRDRERSTRALGAGALPFPAGRKRRPEQRHAERL